MRLNGVASTYVPIDRLTILIDKPSEKISSAVSMMFEPWWGRHEIKPRIRIIDYLLQA